MGERSVVEARGKPRVETTAKAIRGEQKARRSRPGKCMEMYSREQRRTEDETEGGSRRRGKQRGDGKRREAENAQGGTRVLKIL